MMENKKLIYLGIGIGLLAIAVITVLYFTYFSCSGHYNVTCHYQDSEEVKNIPCTSNSDCSADSMISYCSLGGPNLLKCAGARYYCGEDGYCKGCDCPLW